MRLIFGAIALLTSALFAAAAKRRFDIAAAHATEALPRFSDQANSELVFSPAMVRGVRTNAIAGEYSARAALELLVAHTSPVATRAARWRAAASRPRCRMSRRKSRCLLRS
jgi:hypothetical protein